MTITKEEKNKLKEELYSKTICGVRLDEFITNYNKYKNEILKENASKDCQTFSAIIKNKDGTATIFC